MVNVGTSRHATGPTRLTKWRQAVATAASSMLAKEVFEGRPLIGCEGTDGEIRCRILVLIAFKCTFCFHTTASASIGRTGPCAG
jgi:hypothetical protein